jgi:hypothetical protein
VSDTYDLHNLGWHSFQQLCSTITREILGQTVESFLDSSDAGKDGAFAGTWNSVKGESLSGRFVIQCKFTSKRDKTLGKSDIADEVEKARKLVKAGRCDSYILMTNAGVSGATTESLEDLFKAAGVKHFRSFGSTWICQQIKENKRLRMLVPRIYGLGDLSQILDERAYLQAKALLASLREELSKVVLTAAYRRAAEALNKHGFVLLVGEPAAGKTTIAAMLSVGALDQWGASTLKLDTAHKVVERWNPDEPSQFFWIDDAFGVLQYESSLVHEWNHALSQVRAMLGKGAKIVMTSRDYIYNRARNDLKEGAFPLLQESQVVIDVRDLTTEEKQQILYNHIKLGKQKRAFRKAIKPHLIDIANHPRFVPETARRLSDPIFTKGLTLTDDELSDFVNKQERFLQEVITGLDADSKAALALIYMRDGSLESPVELEDSEREALERLGSGLGKCITALDSLNGSLVQFVNLEDSAIWRFKHPTIGDAYAALLLRRPEWLGIYVRGASLDKLLGQITCGDVGLEKAVILPKTLFSLILRRLDEPSSVTQLKTASLRDWHSRHRVDDFLASRCSAEFLTEYLRRHENVFGRVSNPGLSLNAVSEVDLAVRLNQLGLLPEEYRERFVMTVVDYTIQGDDFYAMESRGIQSMFTPTELAAFRDRVRSELVPNLADVRRNWQSNHDSDYSPAEFLEPLLDGFSQLKKTFAADPKVVQAIDREIELANDWIADESSEEPERDRPARKFGDVNSPEQPIPTSRSLFDDIDE